MTMQYGTTLRNAQLDAIETTVGTTPKIQIWSGAQPATCATADSGTMLFEEDMPSDWMAAASAGSKAKSGTWSAAGVAAGTAGHFRVKDSTGVTCHIQGSVTVTGGGGDMTVTNTSIAIGQTVTIDTFTISAGNA